jgi:hypothetical protein
MDIGQAARTPGAGFDMGSYGDLPLHGLWWRASCYSRWEGSRAVAVSGLSTQEDIDLAKKGVDAILQG